jgi:hypothetical protein
MLLAQNTQSVIYEYLKHFGTFQLHISAVQYIYEKVEGVLKIFCAFISWDFTKKLLAI